MLDNKEMKEAIAANVKAKIKKEGCYQADVAEAAGIPRGSISQILNGVQSFKVEDLIALCNVMGWGLFDVVPMEFFQVDPVDDQRKEAMQAAVLKMQATIDGMVKMHIDPQVFKAKAKQYLTLFYAEVLPDLEKLSDAQWAEYYEQMMLYLDGRYAYYGWSARFENVLAEYGVPEPLASAMSVVRSEFRKDFSSDPS